MPKISVLLPAYNAQNYLREAIESILNQTFNDFEFLIYNDGSTDSTKIIINSYNDKRIKAFHSDENKGYVHWLNIGLKEAQGKYVARMDADDISLPERFQLQWDFMETHLDFGVCGSQIEIINSGELVNKPFKDDEIRWWFFKGNPIAHPSVMIRKSVLEKHQFFYNKSLQPAEDFDMWWRMAHVVRLANLNNVLLKYRYHEMQESTAKVEIQKKHHNESLKHFFEKIGLISEFTNSHFISKLYSDELKYDYKNLKAIVHFFKRLYNPKAIEFFGVESIEKKSEEVVNVFFERMSSYHPSMLFFLTWDSIMRFHNQKNQSILKFIFKCLVCWKTRIK